MSAEPSEQPSQVKKGGGRGSAIGLSVICDLRLCRSSSRSSCAERKRDRGSSLLPAIDVTCNASCLASPRLEIYFFFFGPRAGDSLARRREGDSELFFKKECIRGTQIALDKLEVTRSATQHCLDPRCGSLPTHS